MPACYYRCFLYANIYGWYAWSRQTSQNEAELKIRWLPLPKALSWLAVCVVSIGLMTVFINPVFAFLTRVAVMISASIRDYRLRCLNYSRTLSVLGFMHDGAIYRGNDS